MEFSLNPSVSKEVVDILSAHFDTKIQIKSAVPLSGSERRNLILRISVVSPSKGLPASFIFKQTLKEKPNEDKYETLGRFARDWAGLEFLNTLQTEAHYSPRFYGGSLNSGFVLLEDFGDNHVSLVDSLTGSNADNAKAALYRFMTCMGQLHADSHGKALNYFKILKKVNPSAASWQDDLKITSDEILPKLEPILKYAGIPLSESHWSEIRGVLSANLALGEFTTFVHGDICPDNVFDNPEKNELYLIDFEWSFVRSALLDGTYLRMSMPTCWCARAIPEELIEPLETSYRELIKKKIPAARDDEAYHDAYVHACAFWLLRTILELEELWDKDHVWPSGPTPNNSLWKPATNLGRPRIFSRLIAFNEVSKKYDKLPYLGSLSEQLLKALRARWPDVKPLELYPAFQFIGNRT